MSRPDYSSDDLQQQASSHIAKIEQTISYLTEKRLGDPNLEERKKDFIRRDIAAMEFVLEYAKEALANRGIRV